MRNGVYIGTYPIKIVALGAIVGFVLLRSVFKMIKGKLSRKELFCQVAVYMNGKEEAVTAMVDTGNLLREPITGASVMIVEKQSLKELLPEEILENIASILKGDRLVEMGEYASRFRVIPFSSLGKQNGMLLGVKVDEIVINTEEEKIKVPNVIVGISEQSLTKNGLYTALIGLEILERRDYNESVRLAQKQY